MPIEYKHSCCLHSHCKKFKKKFYYSCAQNLTLSYLIQWKPNDFSTCLKSVFFGLKLLLRWSVHLCCSLEKP